MLNALPIFSLEPRNAHIANCRVTDVSVWPEWAEALARYFSIVLRIDSPSVERFGDRRSGIFLAGEALSMEYVHVKYGTEGDVPHVVNIYKNPIYFAGGYEVIDDIITSIQACKHVQISSPDEKPAWYTLGYFKRPGRRISGIKHEAVFLIIHGQEHGQGISHYVPSHGGLTQGWVSIRLADLGVAISPGDANISFLDQFRSVNLSTNNTKSMGDFGHDLYNDFKRRHLAVKRNYREYGNES